MSTAIAEIQEKKERDIQQKYESPEEPPEEKERRDSAARAIQRTFRGHRERRTLKGLSLDPSTRWTEAIKEAQYKNLITPRSKTATFDDDDIKPVTRSGSAAQNSWARAGKIARRATADEDSSLSSSASDSEPSCPVSRKKTGLSPAQKEVRKQKKLAAKQERAKSAKTMDLSYFLEMVDVKHRYGSNLRKYHAEWQSRSTHENFFYWLDHGEGMAVDLPNCSRQRLESMQVRYLSKEERRLYEVVVGDKGKLVWRKDEIRVDTTPGMWKDSVAGIVKADSKEIPWAHDRPILARGSSESSGLASDVENDDPSAQKDKEAGKKSEDPGGVSTDKSKKRRSLQDFFRRSSRSNQDENKATEEPKKKKAKQVWIFVADTKNNLYIGLKQSGAFQHSSFLHGSRISAAGLIQVKDGQLRILQPRSGHYRTPSHNLHIFIKSLEARGVDMSFTAVGGSYAAMVGIEAYMKTKGRIKGLKEGMRHLTIKEKDEEHAEPDQKNTQQPSLEKAPSSTEKPAAGQQQQHAQPDGKPS